MGGASAGDVASRIASESVRESCSQGESLVAAIEKAHENIRGSHVRGIGSRTMGSTIVAAQLDGSDYEIAWVGDSRAYLWDGKIKQLTRDHSWVQRQLDEGVITPEQARVSPDRNVITQCLGGSFENKLVVDTVRGHLHEGERLILCSDGLLRDLSDEQFANVLERNAGGSDDELAANLIEAAGGSRASDNVTVVVISQRGYARSTGKRVAFLLGMLVTLGILVSLAYFGSEKGTWHEQIQKWLNAE